MGLLARSSADCHPHQISLFTLHDFSKCCFVGHRARAVPCDSASAQRDLQAPGAPAGLRQGLGENAAERIEMPDKGLMRPAEDMAIFLPATTRTFPGTVF